MEFIRRFLRHIGGAHYPIIFVIVWLYEIQTFYQTGFTGLLGLFVPFRKKGTIPIALLAGVLFSPGEMEWGPEWIK